MPDQKRILIDCDGTLTSGPGPTPDSFAPLNTGTRSFLGALKDRGYEIIIFSARSPVELVKNFFRREGLTRYVDGFTRTKQPSRIILDDRAIRFNGNYEHTLKEIDGFRTHWDDADPKYAYAGINTPYAIAEKVRDIGKRIPSEMLHANGREGEPHVTVLYGLDSDDPAHVRSAVTGFGPVTAKIGLLSLFETPKHDVLKLNIESDDLHRLHYLIQSKVPHVQVNSSYQPHITVSYLVPGKGSDYTMLDNPLLGEEFSAQSAIFSDRSGKRTIIPLI